MKRPLIAPEGWVYIATLAGLTVLALWWNPWLAVIPGAVLGLTIWFFRDPERSVGGADGDVVAPADGRVMWVRTIEEPRFVQGKALVISIFLSLFDVHVNRAPVGGRVGYRDYVPGRFVAAWADQVETVNERAYVGIEGPGYRVLVVQIAGLVARRIITWPQVGQVLQRGERFGLIKFGSCTQVYLPADSEALVAPGDRVVAGRTVVGRIPR